MAARGTSSDPAGPSGPRRSTRTASSSTPQLPSHFSEDDFDHAVTALQQDLSDYRTGNRVKGSWTAVIKEFCRRPNCSPFDFGVWALDNIGADNVLTILIIEFGTDRLEDTYNTRRKDSASLALSKYLGLPSAHLLALWFGADGVRTPEARTISILRTAICEGDSTDFSADRKAQNLDRFVQACRTGFEHWAERLGLDLSLDLSRRSNKKTSSSVVAARTCCIWASDSTLSALSHDQRRLAKLRPSDLQLLRGGASRRENSNEQSAAMEYGLTASNHTSVVGNDGESPTIIAQVEASSSNAASHSGKGKTTIALPEPVIPREHDDDNDDADEDSFRTLGLSKKQTGPSAVENNDGVGPDDTALEISQPLVSLPEMPGNNPSHTHQQLSPQVLTPPSTAQVIPQTPSTAMSTKDKDTTISRKYSDMSSSSSSVFDGKSGESHRLSLQSQLTESDMSPDTGDSPCPNPLKRQSHPPAAEVSPSRPPKRARFAETATEPEQSQELPGQPQQLPEAQSPIADQQQEEERSPSPEGDPKQLQDMHDVMVATLKDNKRWLGGETVDHFLQWAAFSNRSYTTATSLMLRSARSKDSLENLAFAKLFVDIETNEPVANVLLGVNIGDTHWIAALLDVSKWTATVYDSLHRPGNTTRTDKVRTSVGEIISVLQPLIPMPAPASGPRAPEIVFASKHAMQADWHNCGVHTIVNSFFLAAGLTPPAKLNGAVWRSILLALATGSSIASTVSSLSPIDARALAVELKERVDEEEPMQFANMGEYMAYSKQRLREMQALRLSICRDTYEGLDKAMRWLERDVVPVMSALEEAATSEVTRLREVLKRLDAVVTEMRRACSAGSLARITQIYETALQSAEKETAMVRRSQKLRLDRAEACVRAVRALDLEGVMQALVASKGVYQDEVEEAEKDLQGNGAC
ncbi:hypothetical protein CONLIGDRAFT_675128 [Coniochaeta ligniaria NRRL 30616]|uniref:Ubiquitin-like protease family profile domain-containing protein n=1 Tax=Coniochaeta ligniaria NRRL 30616 TaxID=1408157 RepID=A0A1J7I4F0_9PEZI|nr:hypothetical protein CONLIGDRAFT_675128 [Coniochaeta ligniaria NRRL 30616]